MCSLLFGWCLCVDIWEVFISDWVSVSPNTASLSCKPSSLVSAVFHSFYWLFGLEWAPEQRRERREQALRDLKTDTKYVKSKDHGGELSENRGKEWQRNWVQSEVHARANMNLTAGHWDTWPGNENTFSSLWLMGEKIRINKSRGYMGFKIQNIAVKKLI